MASPPPPSHGNYRSYDSGVPRMMFYRSPVLHALNTRALAAAYVLATTERRLTIKQIRGDLPLEKRHPDRTVQYWLAKLLSLGLVEREWNSKGHKYRALPILRRIIKDAGVCDDTFRQGREIPEPWEGVRPEWCRPMTATELFRLAEGPLGDV